jgi:DNA-binding PadR family transcriptional regulator
MSLARARELAVLSLLAAHPAHGYEIAKAVASGPLAPLGLSRAAVYAILDRFRTRGWVEEHPEPGGAYPDRTVLSLTDAARAALEQQIAAIGTDPLPTTVPLIAVAMCLDSGADLPAGALDALVADRERALARLPADAAHATSATGRLARRVIEAELSILREFCGEPPA